MATAENSSKINHNIMGYYIASLRYSVAFKFPKRMVTIFL